VLESNILTKYHTAQLLTAGVTYRFRVAARNIVGYSFMSNFISVLAAQEPDKPDPPATRLVGGNVEISWTDPGTGGSPITGY